jgi:hypothetical protein
MVMWRCLDWSLTFQLTTKGEWEKCRTRKSEKLGAVGLCRSDVIGKHNFALLLSKLIDNYIPVCRLVRHSVGVLS